MSIKQVSVSSVSWERSKLYVEAYDQFQVLSAELSGSMTACFLLNVIADDNGLDVF